VDGNLDSVSTGQSEDGAGLGIHRGNQTKMKTDDDGERVSKASGKSVSFEGGSEHASRDDFMKFRNVMGLKLSPKQLRMIDSGPYRSLRCVPAIHNTTPVNLWFRGRSSDHGEDDGKDDGAKGGAQGMSASDEAECLAACRHPHILYLIGTVTLQGRTVLVTERSACSVEEILDEVSNSLDTAVRIMYQISTALAYLHDLGICHGAIEARSVLLMQRVFSEPIAKLSEFSECRSKTSLFRKDLVDFAALLELLTVSRGSAGTSDTRLPTSKIIDDVNQESRMALTRLIGVACEGNMSVSKISMSLMDIDVALHEKSDSVHVSSTQTFLDSVQRCGGCFSSQMTRIE
jgi:serine/threonine protein kinase